MLPSTTKCNKVQQSVTTGIIRAVGAAVRYRSLSDSWECSGSPALSLGAARASSIYKICTIYTVCTFTIILFFAFSLNCTLNPLLSRENTICTLSRFFSLSHQLIVVAHVGHVCQWGPTQFRFFSNHNESCGSLCKFFK